MVGVNVMARIDLRGADLSAARLRAALPRGGVDVEAALSTVRPIVDAVADRGAEAALEYGESLDGVRPPTVRVPSAELDAALAGLDRDVRAALEVAIERTRAVHADQRRSDVHDDAGRLAPPSPSGGFRSTVSACTCPAGTRCTRRAW